MKFNDAHEDGERFLEVFRSGDYGDKGKYTAEDLARIAADYDPAKHEAPITIGDPALDSPAMGWVEKLKVVGNTLLAKFRQVEPKFWKAFDAGRLSKRTVAIGRSVNETPLLKYIAFKGESVPTLRGLGPWTFAEVSNRNHIKLSVGDRSNMRAQFADLSFREIEEQINQTIGERYPEQRALVVKMFPEYCIFKVVDGDNATKLYKASYSVSGMNAKLSEKSTEIIETTEYVPVRAEMSERDRSRELPGARFVERLKANGRWLHDYDLIGIPQLFAELSKAGQSIHFSDSRGNRTASQVLFDFFNDLHHHLPAEDIAIAARRAARRQTFAAQGFDASNQDLAEEAEIVSRVRKIPYGEALKLCRSRKFEFNSSPSYPHIDPRSIEIANAADLMSRRDGVSYGEALRRINAGER